MSALGRMATYVLPAGAIALGAAVILGPGAQRAVVGVRLWGLPVEGGEALALRIEAARRLLGVEDTVALSGIEVTATSGGAPLPTWVGETGADGIGEARLQAPGGMKKGRPSGLQPPVVVRVARAGGMLLEQELPLSPPARIAADEAAILGATQGELQVQVEAVRGVLAAPFPGELRVTIRGPGGTPAAGARLEVSAEGADLAGGGRGPALREADGSGIATLEITPRSHLVDVSVEARRDEAAGQWVGRLPVVPGAIWLKPLRGAEPGKALFRLIAPAPKEQAYVSIVGEHGRTQGAVVPLAAGASGFWSGETTLDLGGEGARCAVVAGDPYEQGSGTIAWPLLPEAAARSGRGVSPRRIALLGDGMPALEARERARARRARWAGLSVVGTAAAAEVLLLLLRSRAAQRRLETHFRDASTAPLAGAAEDGAPLAGADGERLVAAARAEPALRVLAFAALIALAFAIVAALAAFR